MTALGTVIVLVLAAVAGMLLFRTGGTPPPPKTGVHLELSTSTARPGDEIAMRVF
jgi:UPF0716 family protein affecting phage T7 exclusion